MTTETATVENKNLAPFKVGEERTMENAVKGGSQSTKKKKIAASIRELKKKYPFCQKDISSLLLILCKLDTFVEVSEAEIIELMILKNEALSKAATYDEKYRIQKDYVSLLLELGTVFYGKDKLASYHETRQKQEEEVNKIPFVARIQLQRHYKQLGLTPPPELEIEIREFAVAFEQVRLERLEKMQLASQK